MTLPPVENRRLLSAYEEMLALVGQTEGIIGVDVGFVQRSGQVTDELGIRVYAADKDVWSEFASPIPSSLHGVEVWRATLESRTREASERPTDDDERYAGSSKPLRPGISVSNLNKAGGTLGLIVDHATKGRCILSCAHVLVYSDASGTEPTVVQPAGGGEREKIGTVDCYFDDDDGDAAIAILEGGRGTEPADVRTTIVINNARPPRLGDIVCKSGMGTKVTHGKVAGCGRFVPLPRRSKLLTRRANLKDDGMDGFTIVPLDATKLLSDDEDSGAIWYTVADGAGVGLHVAGERFQYDPEQEFAIACYLSLVLERLEVTPATTPTP